MPVICLGISHHTAPLEVRERHAVPAARIAEALVALCDYEAVREAVMLSTCNRMEIYAELADYELGLTQLKQFLQNFRHGSVADMQSYLYTSLGLSAVEHLFRVTTGLDSMLIGEAEILGQVKTAYLSAQHAGTVGPTLHTLFRAALHVGKQARSQTRIGAASLSVPTAAIELARHYLGDVTGVRALVIGAGKMGQLTARRLHELGVRDIIVANRTLPRALEVVKAIGAGRVIGLHELPIALSQVDVVITAAGATRFLLTPDQVRPAAARERKYPLVFIDIAVPRDIDPDVAALENVRLIDIDVLRDVVDDHLERRRTAIPMVEAILAEQIERFAQWYRGRPAISPISMLARQAETIRSEEIDRLFGRCPDLSERERRLVIGTSRRILSRLLHPPFAQIRTQAVNNLPQALELGQALTMLFRALPPQAQKRPVMTGQIVQPSVRSVHEG